MLLYLAILFFSESRQSSLCCEPKLDNIEPFFHRGEMHHKKLCPCVPIKIKVCDSLAYLSNILICHERHRCCEIRISQIGKICKLERLSCSRYIKVVLQIIISKRGELPRHEREKIRKILKCIFEYVGDCKNTLSLFTASALHNTSFLKVFRSKYKGPYISRGLLQIQNYDNYKVLSELSGIDFVKKPHLLENPCCPHIKAEAKFFRYIMKKLKYTFVNMMKALNPKEYQIYEKSCGRIKTDAWKNRYALYLVLKRKL